MSHSIKTPTGGMGVCLLYCDADGGDGLRLHASGFGVCRDNR